jgi:hypothetical protein
MAEEYKKICQLVTENGAIADADTSQLDLSFFLVIWSSQNKYQTNEVVVKVWGILYVRMTQDQGSIKGNPNPKSTETEHYWDRRRYR